MKRQLKKTSGVYHPLLAYVGNSVTLSASRFICPIRWPKAAVKPEQGRLLSTTCTRTGEVLSAVWGCALDAQSGYCESFKEPNTVPPSHLNEQTQKSHAAHPAP